MVILTVFKKEIKEPGRGSKAYYLEINNTLSFHSLKLAFIIKKDQAMICIRFHRGQRQRSSYKPSPPFSLSKNTVNDLKKIVIFVI